MESNEQIKPKKSLKQFDEDHEKVKKIIDEFAYKYLDIISGTNTRVRPTHAFMLEFVFDGEVMDELYE